MGVSAAGQEPKGCDPTMWPWGTETPAFFPQPPIQSFPLWLHRVMSKTSAYGRAMVSEKKYS